VRRGGRLVRMVLRIVYRRGFARVLSLLARVSGYPVDLTRTC